ncbi:Zinc finger, ZZ-type [Dillenia turbinata]|uniref:Zinc finger, ZZ-type n=1 Tax=Dillenia turbinata TaxID=194707 RepID=A0AAN8UM10_9MAGN
MDSATAFKAEENFPPEFLCCICLELFYKPVVIEQEKKIGCYLVESDGQVSGLHFKEELNSLGKKCTSTTVGSSEIAGTNNPAIAATTLESLEVTKDRNSNKNGPEESDTEHGTDAQQISVADFLCIGCKQLLFRPVVLNCGHVYCELCIMNTADGKSKCQVCQMLDPNSYTKVCLILEHFLEEHFPEEYSQRRDSMLKEANCLRRAEPRDFAMHSFAEKSYPSWCNGNVPNVHCSIGCDYCGMSPIIGNRYRCKDCKEKIGFDLCEACYNNPSNLKGRFNQRHKPDHRFQIIKPGSMSMLSALIAAAEETDVDDTDSEEDLDDDSLTTFQ